MCRQQNNDAAFLDPKRPHLEISVAEHQPPNFAHPPPVYTALMQPTVSLKVIHKLLLLLNTYYNIHRMDESSVSEGISIKFSHPHHYLCTV